MLLAGLHSGALEALRTEPVDIHKCYLATRAYVSVVGENGTFVESTEALNWCARTLASPMNTSQLDSCIGGSWSHWNNAILGTK